MPIASSTHVGDGDADNMLAKLRQEDDSSVSSDEESSSSEII